MLALDQWRTDHHAMRITATTTAEADLLARRLQALRHALGPDVVIDTNLHSRHLEELLGSAMDAADLERALQM